MTKLFLDFDGVVNFEGSRSAYRKNRDTLGYLQQDVVHSRLGIFRINYSAELVRKLNSAHTAHGFEWLWLTTWVNEAKTLLDPQLSSHSDGSVDWDPHSRLGVDYQDTRASRKYEALKKSYDGEPFVWVDDEATVKFDAADFDVPTLVVAPNPTYGVSKTELATILEFFAAHSGKDS